MSNLREAAQAALDALSEWPDMEGIDLDAMCRAVKAVDALCAALAQAEPFKPETWPTDADGHAPPLCKVCGTPVAYGERHRKCAAPEQPDQPTADGPTDWRAMHKVFSHWFLSQHAKTALIPEDVAWAAWKQAYAEGVAQEKERCVRVCEEVEDSAWALWKTTADPNEQGRSIGAQHCADAIRKG